MTKESLFDIWSRREPDWDVRYEDAVIKKYCDYGKGRNDMLDNKAKVFGAGYEVFIVAFFIGLYQNGRKPLPKEDDKTKHFGWAIQNWGNFEERLNRHKYNILQQYIFAALVARTDIDLIELDKGKISASSIVDKLMVTMEEYANYGFDLIKDKQEDMEDYFYNENGFLNIFLEMMKPSSEIDRTSSDVADDEPESLDEEDGAL